MPRPDPALGGPIFGLRNLNKCLKGSLVRLTYGLVAPGMRDLCYVDDGE